MKNSNEFFFLLNHYDEESGALKGIKELHCQQIMKIDINFSQFEVTTAYKEFSPINKIKSFNIDQGTNRFIILYKNLKESRSSQSQNFYYFKIFDIGTR